MAATIVLRQDKLASLRRVAKIKTDRELAECIGMDPSTVSRILSGTQAPGAAFIASVCDYFGADFFTDLFEVAGAPGEVTE